MVELKSGGFLCQVPGEVNSFEMKNGRKGSEFARLIAEAARCVRCPAMCERAAVLSELNGSVDARVMFIGEAPGRKGADRTHVPFSGDQSGRNFDRFLASVGLARSEVFITRSEERRVGKECR